MLSIWIHPMLVVVCCSMRVVAKQFMHIPQQHRRLRSLVGDGTDYTVELIFELRFVNEDVASQIESRDPMNDLVEHFCTTVANQAGGEDADTAAHALDATISTAPGPKDCTILNTSRVYDVEGQDLLGDEYLALQVQVSQVVTVSSRHFLWLEEVTMAVQNAFNYPDGGNLAFRRRLNAHDAFGAVYTVGLLDNLSLSQDPPTYAPSALPTIQPSFGPSSSPSLPSDESTSSSPSDTPTVTPSFMPPSEPDTSLSGLNVSNDDNDNNNGDDAPTSAPSQIMTSSQSANHLRHSKKQTIVEAIAAIVAALLIVTSCGLIIWLFHRRRARSTHMKTNTEHPLTSQDGQPQRHETCSIVPGVVELDDDHRSLANTTLGDQTAGRRPHPKKSKRAEQIQPLDSFDENSLYTTPFSLQLDDRSVALRSQTAGPSSILSQGIIKAFEYEDNILFPMSDTNTESSDGIYSARGSGPVSVDSCPVSVDEGPIDVDTQEPYCESADSRLKQHDNTKARQVSQALDDGKVMDLNPFHVDELSIEQQEIEACPSTQSDNSRSTRKVGNILRVSYPLSPYFDDNDSEGNSSSGKEEERQSNSPRIKKVDQNDEGRTSPENNQEARLLDMNLSRERNLSFESVDIMTDNQSMGSLSTNSKKSRSSKISRESAKELIKSLTSTIVPQSSTNTTQSLNDIVMNGPTSNATLLQQRRNNLLAMYLEQTVQLTSPIRHSRSIPPKTPEVDETSENDGSGQSDPTSCAHDRASIDDISASSSSTSVSASPWLFDAVEQTLGPRSVIADMESLSGKSNLSIKSHRSGSRSVTSLRSRRSVAGASSIATGSVITHGTRNSHSSSLVDNDLSVGARTLEHDLKRLEMQLAILDSDQMTTSSNTVSSIGHSLSSFSSRNNRPPKISTKKRIVVIVPPGRLGVVLANRHDGKGTFVSEVRSNSSLKGMLSPGDKLVAVDGEDVTGMVVSQITSLMAAKAHKERRLTVITTVSQQHATTKMPFRGEF